LRDAQNENSKLQAPKNLQSSKISNFNVPAAAG
jgi:hypothetical protein